MNTEYTKQDIYEKVQYLKENINAIECFLSLGKLQIEDVILYTVFLGTPLESINQDFKIFNTDYFKKMTKYYGELERNGAIDAILNKALVTINSNLGEKNLDKDTLYVYTTSLDIVKEIKNYLRLENIEIKESLKIQNEQVNVLTKRKSRY